MDFLEKKKKFREFQKKKERKKKKEKPHGIPTEEKKIF